MRVTVLRSGRELFDVVVEPGKDAPFAGHFKGTHHALSGSAVAAWVARHWHRIENRDDVAPWQDGTRDRTQDGTQDGMQVICLKRPLSLELSPEGIERKRRRPCNTATPESTVG